MLIADGKLIFLGSRRLKAGSPNHSPNRSLATSAAFLLDLGVLRFLS